MIEVKRIPENIGEFKVDCKQPRKCLISGLFEEEVMVGDEKRSFYTYIKDGLLYNSPCVVIVPPDDKNILEYIEKGPWLDFAMRHDVFLHILKPGENGWKGDGSDAAYMNQTYVQINSRRAYVTMQDNIYAVGIGRGATVAQQAVMAMMSEWSGLATFGDLSSDTLRSFVFDENGKKTGETELVVSASKVQVPVWMTFASALDKSDEDVVQFWRRNNDSSDEVFSNCWADRIYFPKTVIRKSQINEEKISEVRISIRERAMDNDYLDSVWAFLARACRHRGFGTKMIRNRIDVSEYGIEKKEIEMGGFTRLWYEYVPDRVKDMNKAVPLVVCMHGRGGSAETFISLSGMTRVAEERDFIVVFPEASFHQQRKGGLPNLLLWDSEGEGRSNDVAFILSIVEDVKKRYLIDSSRIYACGQSSGGMMTSALAQKAPDVFAAAAPWSSVMKPNSALNLPEKIEPAVPYFFLLGEKDWLCTDWENGEMEYHVKKDIASFLRNLMKIYALDEQPLKYTCGEISYYVYLNKKKVPMLTVGTVREMSHANYPGESWISYDQFMSRFSKVDGKLLYMGESAL